MGCTSSTGARHANNTAGDTRPHQPGSLVTDGRDQSPSTFAAPLDTGPADEVATDQTFHTNRMIVVTDSSQEPRERPGHQDERYTTAKDIEGGKVSNQDTTSKSEGPASSRLLSVAEKLLAPSGHSAERQTAAGSAGNLKPPEAATEKSVAVGESTTASLTVQETGSEHDNNGLSVQTSSGKLASSTAPPEKAAIKRNLSTCRLKKSANISDVYDISSQILGTGISGAVRVANHKVSGRRYAIKTLSLEGINAKRTAMLHNEVSIYLQLDHPNIAKLIEVYETERAIHLVMELCTGGELYDRLAAKKKYSESDAAKVAQQMLSAINYCHQHRICHRDLKLENWVYADQSPDAPLKLIDFGFSRIFSPGVPMTAMHGTVYYVSPEVMDGCYQEKCDIWSIGVIVYMLLSGSPPFNGSYDHEILIKIKRGAYNFSGPRWDGITSCAKSFIALLLQKDPDKRPSAEEALQLPWLQRRDTVDHDIDLSVVKSMRDFALGNILRRAALGVVALGMTSQEVAALETVFRQLDKSNRGTIQLQDLANVLREKLNINDTEAQRIFERIDQTGTREVHYSEFIAATLQAKFIQDDRLIKEAFQRFDVDHKQRITLDNLRSVLGDSYNGSRVEDILRLCDCNGDGYIDYEEFYKALTSDEPVLAEHGDVVLTPDSTTITASASPTASKKTGLSRLGDLEKGMLPRTTDGTREDQNDVALEEGVITASSAREGKEVAGAKARSSTTAPRECTLTALQSMRKATTCLRAAAAAKSVCVEHTFIAQNTS